MSRSLLAISWAMPPALFPRSLQVARSLKALAERGWCSTVICATPPADAIIDMALRDRYESSYTALRVPVPSKSPKISQYLRRFTRAADLDAAWVAAATEAAARASAVQEFQALISFAQPWSDHAIALKLAAQRLGEALSWRAG